ncbi:MAG: type II secretion system protein [Verrucomicrobiales bacterium]|nr:type II secretion system protein [Verrucomicrobiales bacterium]
MNIIPEKRKKMGFTLIEMTLAVVLSVGIAAVIVVMVQQQISITSTINRFSFLREDAPQINVLMSNLITQADDYRIYPNTANAKAALNAVTEDGNAIRLRFRLPDGSIDNAIVAFETISGKKQLSFYYKDSGTPAWQTAPDWVVSSRPDVVRFSNNTGVLEITLVGKYGEEVTFAGNPI